MISVRTEARQCLRLTGAVSAREDLLTVPTPPTLSLRKAVQFIHRHRCRPKAPSFLQLTEPPSVSGTLSLSWRDNSDNEDGFSVRFRGRRNGFSDHEGSKAVGATAGNAQQTTLAGLRQGFEYTLTVVAFNAAGESAPSEAITRAIPIDEEPTREEITREVALQREQVTMGFVPYKGTFPFGGIEPKGRLLKIHLPLVSAKDRLLKFPKQLKSTANCGTEGDVIVLEEGGDLTGDALKEIFGAAEPEFSILSPLTFTACLSSPGFAPSFVTIKITVRRTGA